MGIDTKKVALLTIGQSPRVDVVPEIRQFLPSNIQLIEAGALDELSPDEISSHSPRSKESILVSRLANGKEVRIDKDFVHRRLQELITLLEESVDILSILCSAVFEPFVCNRPLVLPYRLLQGFVSAVRFPGPLGVLVPATEQVETIGREFESWGVEVVTKAVSPYAEEERLEEVVQKLLGAGVSAILLDCFGYSVEMKQRAQRASGLPVITVRTLLARALAELL